MLPTKDGWQVVAELRRGGVRMPILFLIPPARALRADKVSIPQTSPVKPLIGKV